MAVAVIATAAVLVLVWWALDRSPGDPVNPQGPVTTTTAPLPVEHPSGVEALLSAPFALTYERSGPAATVTVDAKIDPTTGSAAFNSDGVTVLVVEGVRYEQLPAAAAGQLPSELVWVRRTDPVDRIELAELFPVEVPTEAGTANLLSFLNLPGAQIESPAGTKRFRLDLPGVTDTDPPSAAAVWEIDEASALVALDAVIGTADGEDRVTIEVRADDGSGIVAPPAATVVDEAALPAAVAALLPA